MRDYSSISQLPKRPGLYCLQGFSAKGLYNAYVGMSGNVQNRISQHLEYKNSSVTTGGSAVSIDPHLVGGCRCWCVPDFEDRSFLVAAELVAIQLLDPVLRSRGAKHLEGSRLAATSEFVSRISEIIRNPTIEISFPDFMDLARKVDLLILRVAALERKLAAVEAKE